MATEYRDLLPAITVLADSRESVALERLAGVVGLSASRVQRVFDELIGQSPHEFERTIALDLAAILLTATDDRVIDIAFRVGFGSHEGFTRAFRSRFERSPTTWRNQHRGTLDATDLAQIESVNRCLRLHHRPLRRRDRTMTYDIDTETLQPVPMLCQRRQVGHDDLGTVLAEALPAVFSYVMEVGLSPAGHPFVRYVADSPAFFTIDAGIPLMDAPTTAPPNETGIVVGELPGGLAAVTTHRGPYDDLGAAHAALDRWIDASDFESAGARWELYLTDPGEVPDPADWLTKVCWPVR